MLVMPSHLEKIENILLPQRQIDGNVNAGEGGKRPADQSTGGRGEDRQPEVGLKIRRRRHHRHVHGEGRGEEGRRRYEHSGAGKSESERNLCRVFWEILISVRFDTHQNKSNNKRILPVWDP